MESNHLDYVLVGSRIASGDRLATVKPIKIQIDPEGSCPHNCTFCNYRNVGWDLDYKDDSWASGGREKVVPGKSGIPWDVMERLIQSVRNLDILEVELTGGGEPTIYPYIKETLRGLGETDTSISLVTNGSKLESVIDDIPDNMDWIRVSLDAANGETHERIHRAKGYAKTLRTMSFIKGTRPRIDIYVSFCIVPENADEIVEATKQCKDLGFDGIKFNAVYTPEGDGALSPELALRVKADLEVAEALADDRFRVKNSFWKIDKYDDNTEFDTCYFDRFMVAIGFNCLVFPCCIVKNRPGYEYGDLRTEPLEEMLDRRTKIYRAATCPPCLPEGEYILTSEGQKKIEDITVGDRVFTHKGRFKRVSKQMDRNFNGDIIRIKATYATVFDIKVTPEHPVLTASFKYKYKTRYKKGSGKKKREIISKTLLPKIEWTDAANVSKGMHVAFPKLSTTAMEDRKVAIQYFGKSVDFKLSPSKELLRLIGYYLAEGYVGRKPKRGLYCIGLTFGKNAAEKEYAEESARLMRGLGLTARVYFDGGWRVINESVMVSRAFAKEFGKGCADKKLPLWVKELPTELLLELIDTFINGDGYKYKNDKSDNYATAFKTVSKQLALDMRDIILKCGFIPSIRTYQPGDMILGRKVNTKLAYVVGFTNTSKYLRAKQTETHVFLPVIEVKKTPYNGKVYNVEVEDDNSYCTLYGAVHNCWSRDHNIKIKELLDNAR